MLSLGGRGLAGVREILCLGAHSDDIEIGCGGTVLSLATRIPALKVVWVVLAAQGERRREAVDSAARFLEQADTRVIKVESFRERYFPYAGAEIKEYFDALAAEVSPDLVLAPQMDDLHQDHRLVAELATNTFRDHTILHYEIPKFDGDLSTPNLYVTLERSIMERKVALLLDGFQTQRPRSWFTAETFTGLARIRGIEAKAAEGYAEGFYCRKIVLL